MAPIIGDGELVLFQGDSITDCGRDRHNSASMGGGYAMIAAGLLSAGYPEKNFRFLNRGAGGDRIGNLQKRWQADCIDLKPDWVSILVGINDTWRAFDSHDPTTLETFEAGYRDILTRTRDQLSARLILCEPFVLPTPPDRMAWRADLEAKINAVRRLAMEFEAIYVPLDGIFAAAAARREPSFWLADGVHPSPAGHALIATAWLGAVGAYGRQLSPLF